MGKKSNVKRIRREDKELIEKLFHHLNLLLEFSNKAFYYYDHENYLGEVAGKLRILVINARQNKALLLKLMDEYQYEGKFIPIGHKKEVTLEDYMEYLAAYRKDEYLFSNKDVVRAVAEQIGASHEDWAITKDLDQIRNEKILFGGPTVIGIIRPIVNTVLFIATGFFLHLHKTKILEKMKIDYTIEQILKLNTNFSQQTSIPLDERERNNIDPKPKNSDLEMYLKLKMKGKIDN